MAAERVRDRADVRPARDVEREVELAVVEAEDLEVVDGRAPRGHLDGDAAAVQPVGALAVDLDRGRGGTGSSTSPRRASTSARVAGSGLLELVALVSPVVVRMPSRIVVSYRLSSPTR